MRITSGFTVLFNRKSAYSETALVGPAYPKS
jgi:hypothetical protein